MQLLDLFAGLLWLSSVIFLLYLLDAVITRYLYRKSPGRGCARTLGIGYCARGCYYDAGLIQKGMRGGREN